MPTGTKPRAGKLWKIMVANAIYSVTMVLWKGTAFPLCRAIERRWKRNVVSPGVFRDSGDLDVLCAVTYFILSNNFIVDVNLIKLWFQ